MTNKRERERYERLILLFLACSYINRVSQSAKEHMSSWLCSHWPILLRKKNFFAWLLTWLSVSSVADSQSVVSHILLAHALPRNRPVFKRRHHVTTRLESGTQRFACSGNSNTIARYETPLDKRTYARPDRRAERIRGAEWSSRRGRYTTPESPMFDLFPLALQDNRLSLSSTYNSRIKSQQIGLRG